MNVMTMQNVLIPMVHTNVNVILDSEVLEDDVLISMNVKKEPMLRVTYSSYHMTLNLLLYF